MTTDAQRTYQREYQRRRMTDQTEREKHNGIVRAYYQRKRQQHAALVAAAAEVTALWAAYAWHGTANKAALDDAVARLDALVGETGRG